MSQGRFDIAQAMQQGFALHRQGNLREAEKLYARVLKAAPETFDALNLLGTLKAQSGKYGEAYRLLASAVKVKADAPEAWTALAQTLHMLKRDGEAIECLDKALALRPDDLNILHNRGSALLSLNRPQHALAAFEKILAANPTHVEARAGRAAALAGLQRYQEALADLDMVVAAAPNHALAHYNRGNVLFALGRYEEAPKAFDRALALYPDNVVTLNNRGRALQALNRHREALADFDRAISLQKDYADAHFNAALALLTLGELPRGFAEYEWRWRRTGMTPAKSHGKPLWLGEFPLARKTILLHAEQGLGDTIQYARYVPKLAQDGAKVVLEVQAELKSLLARVAGVAACLARGEKLPDYDVHCPMGSLPFALKTDSGNVPANIPYLAADPARIEKWRPKMESLGKPRVALTWAGQAMHQNDANRSVALSKLEPLFSLDNIRFVSIQRDLRPGDEALLAKHPNVLHAGGELADMDDTAAVLALCDLLISVDTSVVHLAGALGRPLWIMVPFQPDWRWTLDQDVSPWYPQARLFRQRAPGDWDDVIERLRGELQTFAA